MFGRVLKGIQQEHNFGNQDEAPASIAWVGLVGLLEQVGLWAVSLGEHQGTTAPNTGLALCPIAVPPEPSNVPDDHKVC